MKYVIGIFIVMTLLSNGVKKNSDSSKELEKRIEVFTEQFNNSNQDKPLVSFKDFKKLVNKVEKHRAKRLIDLKTFQEMSKQHDVVILDARAEDLYKTSHIKGAINLPFTKFTQLNLMRVIPDPNTKILIYCNNNIQNDQINFASKIALPKSDDPIMLALNIPTYINLYGYGYKNVYELNGVIDVLTSSIDSSYIQFEGTKFVTE